MHQRIGELHLKRRITSWTTLKQRRHSGKKKIASLAHLGSMRGKQILPHCNAGTISLACADDLIMFQIGFGRLVCGDEKNVLAEPFQQFCHFP